MIKWQSFVVVLLLLSFSGEVAGQSLPRGAARQRAEELTALGRALFFDPSLSASGKLACATCHSPAHAYGPPNDLAVQLGGIDLRQPGARAVPSLMYLNAAPQFTEHYFESDDEGDESIDNGPTGGLTWDGRADRGRDQARLPLLSPYEMANATARDLAERAARTPYAKWLRTLFGADLFDNPERALGAITIALETFEEDPATFYPYDSKYDAYLAGKATLSSQEARGLAAFQDPAKGNCSHCHISERARDGTPPQFTDYGLVAIGVPRNPSIPANTNPSYYDLGVCGPMRTDLRDHPEYCGLFLTPTLRNVATRRTFFHNGALHNLRDAVAFYATRDTNAAFWYPRNADGTIRKFDDLPAAYRKNLSDEPPFDRHAGDLPALSEQEVDDITAFLQTLTDGYK
jgi:cytochrome c peroxidase